ncbi:hypothetical protein LTR62_005719 [Meristemomyces frigidus]|uniref:Peptidase A1 domain-containing protein n=1 Tax=Meristemomyces frigidus TaxID=1508187 RepID=A0AAN7YJ03_9PEZI|nr:hypothetical protein LTR62_005719 [Meristemomyces frigidus]
MILFLPFVLTAVSAAPSSNRHISAILPLTSVGYGFSYDIAINFASQPGKTFQLTVDTSGADLWVRDSDWQCQETSVNGTASEVERADCPSGNTTFDYPDAGDHYGVGDVYGTVGLDDISFPGCAEGHKTLTFSKQEMGVANLSGPVFDSLVVGILGLGYSAISSIQPNSFSWEQALAGNPSLLEQRVAYPTVFQRLIGQGMEPYISLALERTPFDSADGFGGYLALGTLPLTPHGPFTSTPVEPTANLAPALTNNTSSITEWTIRVEGLFWTACNGTTSTSSTNFQAVVDSGQNLNLFPAEQALAINAAFRPPAVLDEAAGVYVLPCNATPPALAVKISDTSFRIHRDDMIARDAAGTCFSTIVPGASDAQEGISLNFLSDAFLKNVVAVFDMGRDEMRFAARL